MLRLQIYFSQPRRSLKRVPKQCFDTVGRKRPGDKIVTAAHTVDEGRCDGKTKQPVESKHKRKIPHHLKGVASLRKELLHRLVQGLVVQTSGPRQSAREERACAGQLPACRKQYNAPSLHITLL